MQFHLNGFEPGDPEIHDPVQSVYSGARVHTPNADIEDLSVNYSSPFGSVSHQHRKTTLPVNSKSLNNPCPELRGNSTVASSQRVGGTPQILKILIAGGGIGGMVGDSERTPRRSGTQLTADDHLA
jgi:hypothetical protein